MESIINFILSNISNINVLNIFFILLSGGIIFVFFNRYYKDKYKLVMEKNKETYDLQSKIINLYKEITNNNAFIRDDKNILSKNDALISDMNRSADEITSNNQFDSIPPIIYKLFFFLYECNELHIFLRKIHLYKKIEYSSNADKLFEAYEIEKEIDYIQNLLSDNAFPILKLLTELKDERKKYDLLKLQINNLFEIYNIAFDEISKKIKEMDSRVEIIMKDLFVKKGKR
jgi:hypothetical protein